jgi:polysaccharide deacetylase 2 family uncharacterized protein YibQ
MISNSGTKQTIFSTVTLFVFIIIHAACTYGNAAQYTKPHTNAIPQQRIKNTTEQNVPVLKAVYEMLYEIDTRPSDISEKPCAGNYTQYGKHDSSVCVFVKIPRGRPIEFIVWDIISAAGKYHYSVSDCLYDESKQFCQLSIASENANEPAINIIMTRSAIFTKGCYELAIVGDVQEDSAYQDIVAFLSMKEHLAIMLLPGKKQPMVAAQLAERYHKEAIIHIPLEPDVKIPSSFPAPVIMVHYTKDKIHGIMSQARKSIPESAGFANLWGSRALEDSQLMDIVMSEIKKNHGYFLEIKAARNSVAYNICKKMNLPYEQMSAVSQEKLRQQDIERILKNYSASAHTNGSAIVAFPLTGTLNSAIKNLLPWFRDNGISLVFPSQIVRDDKEN